MVKMDRINSIMSKHEISLERTHEHYDLVEKDQKRRRSLKGDIGPENYMRVHPWRSQ